MLYILLGFCVLLTGCINDVSPGDPFYAPIVPDPKINRPQSHGTLYQVEHGLNLFEDVKAHAIGDIITVTLVEKITSSKDSKHGNKKAAKVDHKEPTLLGTTPRIQFLNKLPVLASLHNAEPKEKIKYQNNVDMSSEFAGEGQSSQNNSLQGTISVTVTQVLPNGNLVIKGERWLELSQGSEFVRISGIIRPQDVSIDNKVSSLRIADAKISYGGKGSIHSASKQGWLSKFFMSPWLPF